MADSEEKTPISEGNKVEKSNSILVLNPTIIEPKDNAYKSVGNLIYALGNQEITNIALTGPYGSGKSSVLKTLRKTATNFTFLNISLATLEANKALAGDTQLEHQPDLNCPLEKCKSAEKKIEDKDLSQLIEYSILQQIIYKEKPESIPQSRFKRIKHISDQKSHKFAVQFVGLLLSGLMLIKPDWFTSNHLYKMFSMDKFAESILEMIALGYILFALYSLIRYLTVTLYNNSLNKINLKDGEIEIAETTSIFNKHLDEIIYFFEVTPYDVIVFEDLDRFKDHHIFLKLRELNTLINESKSVNKHIVFIYAVRDDIFKDTSRTKFFDYIETIIPVINPSNSSDLLYNYLKEFIDEKELPLKVYRELGQFIDDMRTLKNIVNEFFQYRTRLDNKLIPRKMLGIIIYKNYFPEDFSLLHNNRGILNDLIKGKSTYISEIISAHKIKIAELEAILVELDKQNRLNELELRTVYVTKYTESINNFVDFISDDKRYSILEIVNSDELFELLMSDSFTQYNFVNVNNRLTEATLNMRFKDIEKSIDSKNRYQDRLIKITEGYRSKILSDITKYNDEIANINSLPLKIILTENECKEYHKLVATDKNRLIDFLLQRGFIEEDYYKYISYFYPGSITPSDHEFLLDLMRRKKYEYNYQLQNIEGLISEIAPQYYKTEAILNLSLVGYIAENSSIYKKEIRWITDVVIRRKNVEFIRLLYIECLTVYLFDFYSELFSKWEDFWVEVIRKVNDANEMEVLAEIYLLFRPKVLSRPDDEIFKNYLNENYSLVHQISDKLDSLDSINTCKLLDTKFTAIYLVGSMDILFTKILELNLYKINDWNIKEVLKFEGKNNVLADYEKASYTTILENCKSSTIEYIKTQLSECLDSIFPASSVYESESTLIALLNMEDHLLYFQYRDDYLLNQNNKIFDLKRINEISWGVSFILNIINPSWENITIYFESENNIISKDLVEYIEENVEFLKLQVFPSAISAGTNEKLFIELFGTNKLQIEVYKALKPLFNKIFNQYDFSQLEEERVSFLIRSNAFAYNNYNYEMIDVNFSYETNLEFFIQNKEKFLDDISNHSIDEEMLKRLIDSNSFNNKEKQLILDANLTNSLITKTETANSLMKFYLDNENSDVSEDIMYKMLSLSSKSNQRILFAKFILDKSGWIPINITKVLETLGGKYKELCERGPKPTFPFTEENLNLFKQLKEKKYISNYFPRERGIKVTTKTK